MTLRQDIRYGCRRLLRSPGFTAIAVLTLALGIGANAAIFSLVDALVFRPLPYAESHRLVGFWRPGGWTQADVEFIREHCKSYENIAAHAFADFTLTGADETTFLGGAQFTTNMFSMLGIRPELGRGFAPEEGEPGHESVTVLSHSLWQRRFGADPEVIGRTVYLNQNAHTIIGVMPEEFHFPMDLDTLPSDLYVPVTMDPSWPGYGRSTHYMLYGRLRDDVTFEQAQAEVVKVADQLKEEFGYQQGLDILFNEESGPPRITSVHSRMVGPFRDQLLLLFAAVVLVLLIACVNVANLQHNHIRSKWPNCNTII